LPELYHFAYLLKSNDDRESVTFDGFDELVMTTISGQNGEIGSTETVIKSSDLADGLVDESLMDQLKIDSALPVDSGKNGWVIVVSNTNNREAPISYVFRHYPDEDETNIITTIDGKGEFPVILGQRAGFLAITWRYEELLNFEIYDVVDGQLLWHDYTFPYDWSDDGEWLIFVEQGSLRLIAPKSRHEIVIPYDLRGCYSAVWADRHP